MTRVGAPNEFLTYVILVILAVLLLYGFSGEYSDPLDDTVTCTELRPRGDCFGEGP